MVSVSQVIAYLKTRTGYVSYKQLCSDLSITQTTKQEFDKILEDAVTNNWLTKYALTSAIVYFRINQNLLPSFPEDVAKPGNVAYETTISGELPEEWSNPNIQYLVRRNQGTRATCVGHAAAYGRDLDRVKQNGPPKIIPPEDKYFKCIIDGSVVIRDLQTEAASYSAECTYAWSRQLGKVPAYAAGSYVSSAVDALRKMGTMLEKDWYTPIYYTDEQVFPEYPSTTTTQAIDHMIDGYIGIRDFDQIKSAIYKYGYVLMPINIYSNYTRGIDGPLPEPAGAIVGSHALCFVGFSKDRLLFLHSWDGWAWIGSISRTYWEKAGGTAYAVIDGTEKELISVNYVKVSISANINCVFYINGEKVVQNPSVLIKDKNYVIRAVPTDTTYNSQDKNILATTDQTITFTFSKPVKNTVLPSYLENIIRAILARRKR